MRGMMRSTPRAMWRSPGRGAVRLAGRNHNCTLNLSKPRNDATGDPSAGTTAIDARSKFTVPWLQHPYLPDLASAISAATTEDGGAPPDFNAALDRLLNGYHGYKRAYHELSAERSRLNVRISSCETERDGYRDAYDEEVTKHVDINERISTLQTERDGYKHAYEEEVANRAEIFGRISSLEAERDGYKHAYEEEVANRAEIIGRISSLEAERDSYKRAYDDETANRAEIFGRISSLEAERDSYKRAYDDETANRAEIFGRISSLEAERDSYKRAYDDETANRAETFGRISSLEAERDSYKRAYDDETAKRAETFGRISSLEAERDGYKRAYDDETANRTEIFGRISSLEAERDSYKRAYEDESSKRNQLNGRISTLVAETGSYKHAYDEEVAKRSEMNGRISTLEVERDGYQQAYLTTVIQLDQARRETALGKADQLEVIRGPRRPTRPAATIVALQAYPIEDFAMKSAQKSAKSTTKNSTKSSGKTSSMNSNHEFDRLVLEGQQEERAGRRDRAIAKYIGAMRLMHRYGPAKVEADRIAKVMLGEAIALRDEGDDDGAIGRVVRSIELNPDSQEARDTLQRLLDEHPGRDLTQECLIFPDTDRATRWYRNAIQTCMDFIVHGGVAGDILEFGVLGGWTARHFAEISRDMAFYGDLYLFDSFEGLPRLKGAVDLESYDVARGLWREEMALPKSWEPELGGTVEQHIERMLSQVISPWRIKLRKGFYSDTLKAPLGCKAALVHMDCDLYQSTVEVFQALERDAALGDGTIIMFDDWNCNRANPAFGQRRAFREFLDRNKGRWDASHFLNYGFNCAAFILHKVGE